MSSKDQPIGGCITEIGCGGAEALLILSRRYRFDHVVEIDIAANVCSKEVPPGFEIIDCNLNEKWPFRDAEIDYLIAMMIIEHLFDPFHAFREIKRCMKKKGSAYVNLPLVTGIRNRIRLLFGYGLKRAFIQELVRPRANGTEITCTIFQCVQFAISRNLADFV